MTVKTLRWIDPNTRQWDSQHGPMVSISIEFEDGGKGQVNTKPEYLSKRLEELTACIGQPGEFTVEDAGNWPDGNPKPLKVRDWPGKPQAQASGGGGGRGSLSLGDRLKLDRFHEASTNARTSIMQAIAFVADDAAMDEVLVEAARIYAWLQEKSSESVVPTAGSGTAGAGSPPSGVTSGPASAPTSSSEEAEGAPSDRGPDLAESTGEGLEAGSGPHTHQWQPAPREGWKLCSVCGNAEKVAA